MKSHLGNDVKLDRLIDQCPDESDASSIPCNFTLPNGVFSSYVTYLIYEMAHFKLIAFFIPLFVILTPLVLLFRKSDLYLLLNIYWFLFGFAGSTIVMVEFVCPITYDNFQIKLLSEVIKRKPPVEGVEWKIIAYNANYYLLDKGLWNTPYYFYSKENCYNAFKVLMEKRDSKKKPVLTISNAGNTQPSTAVEIFLNDMTRPHSFTSDSVLEAYFVKAAEVQKQAEWEYWRKQYPDMEAL